MTDIATTARHLAEANAIRSLVLEATDVDCDGVGVSFTRVTVPAYLAAAYLTAMADRDADAAKVGEEQARGLAILRDAATPTEAKRNGFEDCVSARDRAEHRRRYGNGKVAGLRTALVGHLVATEQHTGALSGDVWRVLTAEERRDLERSLEGFDATYWREEGYTSTFYAR